MADAEQIKVALDLYAAAQNWRTRYFRQQINPENIRNVTDQRAYDLVRTSFGDDAFDILMDYTEADD